MKFERIATEGGAILYDPSRTGNAAGLFDIEAWRARGALSAAPGGRGTVLFLDDGPRRYALRRYLRGGLAARVARASYLYLGEERTRSFHELRLLADLRRRGLPVPAPVAARYRRQGLAYQAELVTERLPDCETLAARWRAGRMTEADWTAAGRCLRRFHDCGVQHADLNAANVMIAPGPAIWLLDFDRGRLRTPGAWRQRPLERLARSLAKLDRLEPGAPEWRPGFERLRAAHDAPDA